MRFLGRSDNRVVGVPLPTGRARATCKSCSVVVSFCLVAALKERALDMERLLALVGKMLVSGLCHKGPVFAPAGHSPMSLAKGASRNPHHGPQRNTRCMAELVSQSCHRHAKASFARCAKKRGNTTFIECSECFKVGICLPGAAVHSVLALPSAFAAAFLEQVSHNRLVLTCSTQTSVKNYKGCA